MPPTNHETASMISKLSSNETKTENNPWQFMTLSKYEQILLTDSELPSRSKKTSLSPRLKF